MYQKNCRYTLKGTVIAECLTEVLGGRSEKSVFEKGVLIGELNYPPKIEKITTLI